MLRKDFIVDPYQLYEAAAAGADAILLIVAALELKELAELLHEARALDLDALVEVHDEKELETALEVEADVLGINNRDLDDFSVDIERTYELLSDVPAGKTVVSESGFRHREELDELERVGVDAVLIGETLMRAPDIEAACRAAGSRSAASRRASDQGQDLRHHARPRTPSWPSCSAPGRSASSSGRSPARRGPRRGRRDRPRAAARPVELVGVFVNQPLDEVAGYADALGLTHVQLHGDEGPAFCTAVAQRTGAKVIKAARIGPAADVQALERFHTDLPPARHARRGPARAAAGETWDWTLLRRPALQDAVSCPAA